MKKYDHKKEFFTRIKESSLEWEDLDLYDKWAQLFLDLNKRFHFTYPYQLDNLEGEKSIPHSGYYDACSFVIFGVDPSERGNGIGLFLRYKDGKEAGGDFKDFVDNIEKSGGLKVSLYAGFGISEEREEEMNLGFRSPNEDYIKAHLESEKDILDTIDTSEEEDFLRKCSKGDLSEFKGCNLETSPGLMGEGYYNGDKLVLGIDYDLSVDPDLEEINNLVKGIRVVKNYVLFGGYFD